MSLCGHCASFSRNFAFFLLAVLCLSEVILNLLVVILHLLQEMITLDDNRASGLVVAP